MVAKNSGKKGNKRMIHGRKGRQCAEYRRRNSRERNKARRLIAHLSRNPNDGCAATALEAIALFAPR